jgi:hypothetical protein
VRTQLYNNSFLLHCERLPIFQCAAMWKMLENKSGGNFFLNLPNPSRHTVALEFTKPLTKISTTKCFGGLKHSQHIRLITSLPSVSQLFRKCGILNKEPYRSPCYYVDSFLLLIYKTP